METIKVNKESLLDAYRNSGSEARDVLMKLFPEMDFRSSLPVIERIKTWDDVVRELCYDPVERLLDHNERGDGFNFEPDEIAYIKLKAIAQVLNEGWTPQFTINEYRWFPWFVLYTKEEIDTMNEEQRSRVVLRSSTRTRMAALRMRMRVSIRRMRARTLVPVLPSRQKNWPLMLESSSLTSGRILSSVRRQNPLTLQNDKRSVQSGLYGIYAGHRGWFLRPCRGGPALFQRPGTPRLLWQERIYHRSKTSELRCLKRMDSS